MDHRSRLATGLVVLAVVLAGCAGTGGGGDAGEPTAISGGDGAGDDDGAGGGDAPSAGNTADPSGDSATPSGDGGGDAGEKSANGDVQRLATDRAIIRTGSVTVRVDDFEAQRDRLNSEVDRLGGYVGGSNVELQRRDNETWTTGTVTLRVPAESFPRMLSYAKDRGEVLSEQTSTTDVSDQLVELDARITNLEGKRARIREFYEQANSTDALLRIENRLSEVQGQIEQLTAKKRSLEGRVTYATLSVTMKEPAPETSHEPVAGRDRAGLLGTLRDSVDSMLAVAYGGLLVAAAALPWLLALLLLAGMVVALRRLVGFPTVRSMLPGTGPSTASPAGGARPASGRGRQDRSGRQPRTASPGQASQDDQAEQEPHDDDGADADASTADRADGDVADADASDTEPAGGDGTDPSSGSEVDGGPAGIGDG